MVILNQIDRPVALEAVRRDPIADGRGVFRGQPRWVLPTLLLILLAAALLYSWNLGYSGLSTYYAASVKSMLENPRAMFFGALDPAATTTLDKLSGFLLPQVLSAAVFGFHAWSLSLPQVVEGLVTVVAGYVIGTRWRGPRVGLAIAALLAFTPMLAAMFGRPMEDGMLTMCVVVAFAAWQRAMIRGSILWLCVAGIWVAVGFQAKMLQAWLILPALLVAYLACAPLPLRRRIGQVASAGAVTIVLSLAWMTAIQLVPANARPWVDGTTANNTYSMVFGYNGIDRLLPDAVPGAVPQLNSSPGSGQTPVNTTATSQAGRSGMKLLLPQFTTQVGWLYPAAVAGILFEWLAWRRSRHRVMPDADGVAGHARAGTALGLLIWLVVMVGVMSAAFVPHATYLAGVAVPLAAFAVSGAAGVWELYTRPPGNARAWVAMPVLIATQTAWAVAVSASGGDSLRWLSPVIAVVGSAALVMLVVPRLRRLPSRPGLFRWAAGVAVAAALLGPISWSLCVLGPGGGGSASDAFAGPRVSSASGHSRMAATSTGIHLRPPFTAPKVAGLDPEQQRLIDYITPRNHGTRIAFATDTMAIAVSVILSTQENPMPMGGFSQRAPTPALRTLRALVESGALRFILLAQYGPSQQVPANPALAADRAWVYQHCAPVLSGHFRDGKSARQTLYDCSPNSPGSSR